MASSLASMDRVPVGSGFVVRISISYPDRFGEHSSGVPSGLIGVWHCHIGSRIERHI